MDFKLNEYYKMIWYTFMKSNYDIKVLIILKFLYAHYV